MRVNVSGGRGLCPSLWDHGCGGSLPWLLVLGGIHCSHRVLHEVQKYLFERGFGDAPILDAEACTVLRQSSSFLAAACARVASRLRAGNARQFIFY